MLRAPYLETAGKSKQKTHQFDSATFVHMWTQAPEVVFTSAPQLLISRRQDPVLNHGWEEIMRLQAVGWSKQSPSTTIMFAPSVRMRYLGEGAGQALRFDIWFQVAESFLTRQSKAAAQASKSKSQIKACAPETTASSPRAPAASRSATRECSEQRPRLLGEGVECDLCQIVQGAAAAVLANPCAYYKCTFENGGQGAGRSQLAFRAQVFHRQPDLSFVRAQSGKSKLENAEQSWPLERDLSLEALSPEPLSPDQSLFARGILHRGQVNGDGSSQSALHECNQEQADGSFPRPSGTFRRSVASAPAPDDPCTPAGGRMHAPVSPTTPSRGKPSARLGSRAYVSLYAGLLGKWEEKARDALQERLADRCSQSRKGTRFERWLAAWQAESLQLFDRFATVETDNRRTQTLDSVAVAALFARSGILLDPASSGQNLQDMDVELSCRISRHMSSHIMKQVLLAKVTHHVLQAAPSRTSLFLWTACTSLVCLYHMISQCCCNAARITCT